MAHHVPVNGNNKYDHNVGVETLPGAGKPPNKNSGKTQVPGDGPRVQRRRENWLHYLLARDAEADANASWEDREIFELVARTLDFL